MKKVMGLLVVFCCSVVFGFLLFMVIHKNTKAPPVVKTQETDEEWMAKAHGKCLMEYPGATLYACVIMKSDKKYKECFEKHPQVSLDVCKSVIKNPGCYLRTRMSLWEAIARCGKPDTTSYVPKEYQWCWRTDSKDFCAHDEDNDDIIDEYNCFGNGCWDGKQFKRLTN